MSEYYWRHSAGKMLMFQKLMEKHFKKNTKMTDLEFYALIEKVERVFALRGRIKVAHQIFMEKKIRQEFGK